MQTLSRQGKLYRTRHRFLVEARKGACVNLNKKWFINFSSNDYLSLSQHPDIKKALKNGVDKYGLGSSSSSLVSGYYSPHKMLEESMCAYLNQERALLFNSGYHANISIIAALTSRHHTVIADKYIHASLIDGMRLSRAHCLRYPHGSIKAAEFLLEKYQKNHPILISESVFSMQGTISDVKSLTNLAKKYHALSIIDDAHGFGVLGMTGRGITEHFHLKPDAISCLVIPLGKALGSQGAIVAGNAKIIETLIQFSRSYIFSTALPPIISLGSLAALKVLQKETWRREKLQGLIRFFIDYAKERSLKLISESLTPIKCIMIGSNRKALDLQQQLMQRGFLVACIRPPSVPENTARLKITLNCDHTEIQIMTLLDKISQCLANV